MSHRWENHFQGFLNDHATTPEDLPAEDPNSRTGTGFHTPQRELKKAHSTVKPENHPGPNTVPLD